MQRVFLCHAFRIGTEPFEGYGVLPYLESRPDSNAVNLAARIRKMDCEVEYITYPKRGHASVVVTLASPYHWLAPVLEDATDYFNRH